MFHNRTPLVGFQPRVLRAGELDHAMGMGIAEESAPVGRTCDGAAFGGPEDTVGLHAA